MYTTLDSSRKEVRLALLAPGQGEDLLVCSLEHISLCDPVHVVPYETISYAWGDTTSQEVVILDEVECRVTASSAAALRRMRLPSTARRLWIDAICINQNDEQERSNQVALMSEVFSLGAGNLIWLGLGHASTQQALESIDVILCDIAQQTHNMVTLRDTLYDSDGNPLWKIETVKTPFNEAAIRRLFSCSWFTRRWVVQEIALSRSNKCSIGHFEVEFDHVLRAAAWIHRSYLTWAKLSWSRGIAAARIMHMLSDRAHGWYGTQQQGDELVSLHRLLTLLRDFESSDPRDIIYGILGLYRLINKNAVAERLTPIVPNYSLSLGAVLTIVATFCVELEQLDLLNDVQRRENEDQASRAVSWRHDMNDETRPASCTISRLIEGNPTTNSTAPSTRRADCPPWATVLAVSLSRHVN